MAISILDFFDFRFNGGRGIRGGQLAADAGIPSYVLTGATYVAADDQIVATLTGVSSVPRPSVLYLFAPPTLPRTDDPLYLRVNTTGAPARINTVLGADVATKDITPGGFLQGVLAATPPPSPRFTLVEPLGIRPPPPPSPWWLQRVERAYPVPGELDLAQLTATFTAAYMQTGVESSTYRATFPTATSVAGYVAVMVPVRYLPFRNGYPTKVGAFSPVFTELSRGHTIGGEEYAVFVLNVYLAGRGISGTFAIRPGAPG